MSQDIIQVTVAYATPSKQVELQVSGEPHNNISALIKKSGVLEQCPEIPFPDVTVGIYGRIVALDSLVQQGDRIEIYRALKMDPKDARRQRA